MNFTISSAEGIYIYEMKSYVPKIVIKYVLEWNLFNILFGI